MRARLAGGTARQTDASKAQLKKSGEERDAAAAAAKAEGAEKLRALQAPPADTRARRTLYGVFSACAARHARSRKRKRDGAMACTACAIAVQ